MSEHQYAMVMDLNKCLGCHTCTMACKKQWTDGDGMEYMYWNNVETRPGAGYPRDWDGEGRYWDSVERGQPGDFDRAGLGGFDRAGQLNPSPLPPAAGYGKASEYNYEDRLFKGSKKSVQPNDRELSWGPNWDEDQGRLNGVDNFYFYLPRICNHCTHPACLEAC